VAAWLSPPAWLAVTVAAATVAALAVAGTLAAWASGAPPLPSAVRVTLWGVGAMGATSVAGRWFGAAP
jgi:VIT1/CCC1 family predicted Fe2+/Mn2+ transporter